MSNQIVNLDKVGKLKVMLLAMMQETQTPFFFSFSQTLSPMQQRGAKTMFKMV